MTSTATAHVADPLRALAKRINLAGPAALSLALASVVFLVGWKGVDQAAQFYRVFEFKTHGLVLLDARWYGGNFPLGYSVAFPALAGLVGPKLTAVVSAGAATWAFDRLIKAHLGTRPLGTWYFAISTLLPVAIGQWPYLAGEALGLLALLALTRNRRVVAALLGVASSLCSPLAAAFLAMVCLAWLVSSRSRRLALLATAVSAMAAVGVIGLAFPGTGPFPYPWESLAATEALCLIVLTPLARTTRAVRAGAVLYAVSSLLSFLVPNPLGGNAPRFAASVGVPLLACFVAPGPAWGRLGELELWRRLRPHVGQGRGRAVRWLALAVVVPFVAFQWAPSRVILSASADPSNQASFYAPLIARLDAIQARRGPVRVEIPPTLEHWESAYVAPYVSLARGWERQLDIADNPIFYVAHALTPYDYMSWLYGEGVSYVALPQAKLDYAAKAEAALLRSGRLHYLKKVWQDAHWTLWRVTGTPGLVSGPARLISLGSDHMTLAVSQPGEVVIRVRYSRFWRVSSGQACLSPAGQAGPSVIGPHGRVYSPPSQWMLLYALSKGLVQISSSVVPAASAATCAA